MLHAPPESVFVRYLFILVEIILMEAGLGRTNVQVGVVKPVINQNHIV